jgi:DNA-binding GntR family transcriptional regulator
LALIAHNLPHKMPAPMPKNAAVRARSTYRRGSGDRSGATALDAIYEQISASIVDQRLPPGTKLNELTLCEIFGVGRRQIAHVLTRLSQDRLVTLYPNRGAFVAAPDVAEARALFEARRILECEITRVVATGATRQALNLLRRNVEEETALRHKGRLRDAVRTSGEFHILLGAAAGNEILAAFVRQLVARTSLVVSLYENQSTMSCWHGDHGALIELLENRRVGPAVALMRRHLSHVEESLNFDDRGRAPLDLRKIYSPASPRAGMSTVNG